MDRIEISWPGVIVVALVLTAMIVGGIFVSSDLALILAGLAGGLLTPGAVRQRSPMLALLVFVPLLMVGCGGALPAHAGAADAVRTMNNSAADAIKTTCSDERGAAIAANPDVAREQAAAEALTFGENCHQAERAQHAFADAHGVWVGFLLQAVNTGSFDLGASLVLAHDIVSLYSASADVADDLGLELPRLPPLITNLFGDTDE